LVIMIEIWSLPVKVNQSSIAATDQSCKRSTV
jgi:hypothetical protein